jgi:hypothetical protein
MKKAVSFLFVFLATFCAAQPVDPKPVPSQQPGAQQQPAAVQLMPLDQIKPGMKGVAYTVFEGTQPEPMDLEVLGVLKNQNGPRNDLILIRLKGTKPEYTGVVAGMSGSPVYIGGRLAGAISYRIGQFSKEPIAGVTPIAQMMEIEQFNSIPAVSVQRPATGSAPQNQKSPTAGGDIAGFTNYLQPIEAPLVFSGFDERVLRTFASRFAAAGIVPVMGVGGVSDKKQPEPLVPGSAVSAVLIRGDMDAAATCTVTYLDATHLLACGHPLLQFGNVDLPMTKAEVVATLPSPLNAFKIVNATETVGSFVQDRHAGIFGEFGRTPQMIPVTLTIHSGTQPKRFHFEVLNNAKLTPVIMAATVFNALQGTNDSGEDVTYRLAGRIDVKGFQPVALQNMFAPADANTPSGLAVAISVGDRFSRIFDNSFSVPGISGVQLDLDVVRERRSARLETARTDITEARPGDEIIIEAVLRPYRGELMVRHIPVKIPTSVAKGPLHILVADGDTLDKMRRAPASPTGAGLSSKLDLASTIALLNKEHANDRLYVSLLEANPEAMIDDKVMPTLPLSVMNVMDAMRGTQEMVVTGESAVNESSTPLNYVISGAQVLTITIK